MSTEHYFLSIIGIDNSEKEVSKEEWINAERRSGFYPKGGGNGPATGGFSGGGIRGRIERRDD